MDKLYSKDFVGNNKQEPKEETVKFLLNFSKSLSVINCNKKQFEMLLN